MKHFVYIEVFNDHLVFVYVLFLNNLYLAYKI